MEFEDNVYFGCFGRYRELWRDVALSRIEIEKPTVILYITFVYFLSLRSSLAFQKLGVQKGIADKFNVNFLKRLF